MSANTHHTKLKGDIAVAAVILDLTKKGYIISQPMSENAPYDLICDTGEQLLRIQVKYRKNGIIPYKTVWSDIHGNHTRVIDESKIDYFALVNEDYTKICYPLPSMKGQKIRFEKPEQHPNSFHYYEDYLDFKTNIQPKHKAKNNNKNPIKRPTKIKWPSKKELEKLVWKKPTTVLAKELGVSDSAVGKRIKALGLTKPPRGYWAKLYSNNL